jgi:superfamily II DNA/RNA helicase
MDQMSRMATLDAFREGRITFLAASDVAARGLDIPDVSHIYNFDVPWQSDDYVHRIGRTGRAGKEGRSLTIVTPDDFRLLKDIEKMLGAPVTWIGEAPSEEDVADGARRKRGRGGRGARPSAERHERRGGRGERNDAVRQGRPRPEGLVEGRPRRHDERRSQRPAQSEPRGDGREARAGVSRHAGQPRSAKPARQPWEPRPPRQPDRHREDRTPAPIGLGDHVPAFLKKPPRVAN